MENCVGISLMGYGVLRAGFFDVELRVAALVEGDAGFGVAVLLGAVAAVFNCCSHARVSA